MMKEKKYQRGIILFFLIATCFLATINIIFYLNESRVTELDVSKENIVKNTYEMQIDTFNVNDGYIEISCWIILKPKPEVIEQYFILEDIENGKYYKIPTEIVDRPDVCQMMASKEDCYQKCGLRGFVTSKDIDLTRNYRVLLLNENDLNKTIIDLDITTQDGEVSDE